MATRDRVNIWRGATVLQAGDVRPAATTGETRTTIKGSGSRNGRRGGSQYRDGAGSANDCGGRAANLWESNVWTTFRRFALSCERRHIVSRPLGKERNHKKPVVNGQLIAWFGWGLRRPYTRSECPETARIAAQWYCMHSTYNANLRVGICALIL